MNKVHELSILSIVYSPSVDSSVWMAISSSARESTSSNLMSYWMVASTPFSSKSFTVMSGSG